jgi:hypothetical protein
LVAAELEPEPRAARNGWNNRPTSATSVPKPNSARVLVINSSKKPGTTSSRPGTPVGLTSQVGGSSRNSDRGSSSNSLASNEFPVLPVVNPARPTWSSSSQGATQSSSTITSVENKKNKKGKTVLMKFG